MNMYHHKLNQLHEFTGVADCLPVMQRMIDSLENNPASKDFNCSWFQVPFTIFII